MVWGIVGSGLEKKRKIIVNHKEQENKKITLDLHQEWLHTRSIRRTFLKTKLVYSLGLKETKGFAMLYIEKKKP